MFNLFVRPLNLRILNFNLLFTNMSLLITDQLSQGKNITYPAQNIIVKDPLTHLQSTSVAVKIPRMNIIDPFTSLYRWSISSEIAWATTISAGTILRSETFINGPIGTSTTVTQLNALLNDMATRLGFHPRTRYLTVTFDYVVQFWWTANPSFQGALGVNMLTNYQGIYLSAIQDSCLQYYKLFPNARIVPSQDGCIELVIPMVLPNGAIPLAPQKVSIMHAATTTTFQHPYSLWYFGAFHIFALSPLRSTTPTTSFRIYRRVRYDNVNFGYLTGTT